jgi:hypothetical protein
MRSLARLAAFVALSTFAAAQAELVFTLNQSQSNFNWSGTSNLGPIVGNPSTAFQTAGTTNMRIYPLAADAIDSADFPGNGDAAVVPDLHGKINNPFPFLPPLATIDITNLHLKASAPQFPVAANGAFSASLTMTAISGTMTVTPLGSAPSVSDLAGMSSTPQAQSGTLTQVGTTLNLVMPVNTTFPFSDPASGASGSITIIGTLRGSWTCPAPATYCTAKVNSLGCTPAISASGTASWAGAAPFTIGATNVLNQKTGLLFYGYAPSASPFQGGWKCVASPTLRSVPQSSGGSASGNDCTGVFGFDFKAIIDAHTDPLLLPGEEVFAQIWSRDPASASTTNLTNAVRFTVAP